MAASGGLLAMTLRRISWAILVACSSLAARPLDPAGRAQQRSLLPACRDRGQRHGRGVWPPARGEGRARLVLAAAPPRLEPERRGDPRLLLPGSGSARPRGTAVPAREG